MQKSVAFLCSSNEPLEFGIKTTHLHLHQTVYLGINVKNMYKIYMRKATKLVNGNKDLKWKNNSYAWIGRFSIVKV